MKNLLILGIVIIIGFNSSLNAQSIIPEPLEISQIPGSFILNKKTKISYDSKDAINEVNYFANIFKTTSDFTLEITQKEIEKNFVKMVLDDRLTSLGNEGYDLNISQVGIIIKAAKPAGLFYACQTIKQLLPAEIDGVYPVEKLDMSVPCLKIKDVPRFSYRGYLLDAARYFIPLSSVKRTLESMAFYKMNTFHWHLTDYQGWRLQIMQYPNLTISGSKIEQTKWLFEGSDFIEDKIPSGGFYTQQEVKELIEYANKLHIRIIPEIDVPAHSLAAIASYPYLSCAGTPQEVRQEKVGGTATVFCPGKESTFEFIENVMDEVMELFPSLEIHIGGDEVNKKEWEKCPHCKKRMEEEELETLHELQSYFVQRIEKYLNKHNHSIIGWDEILEGGLAPNATVMSWRGTKGGIKAAKMGHKVIMTPIDFCYFDHCQGKDKSQEPYVRFKHYLPLSKVYSYEPIPEELNEKEAELVLGAQANMWTNFIKHPSHVEYMTYPRLCALAELTWSAKEKKDFQRFSEKLESHYPRMEQRHVIYRKPPQE
jgi:hexosaminidase